MSNLLKDLKNKIINKKMDPLAEHIINEKKFIEFSHDEFLKIPVEYIIKKVKPCELLEIWTKLPYDYRANEDLQERLPCFIHYNRKDMVDHVDGPVPSQYNCHSCNMGRRFKQYV